MRLSQIHLCRILRVLQEDQAEARTGGIYDKHSIHVLGSTGGCPSWQVLRNRQVDCERAVASHEDLNASGMQRKSHRYGVFLGILCRRSLGIHGNSQQAKGASFMHLLLKPCTHGQLMAMGNYESTPQWWYSLSFPFKTPGVSTLNQKQTQIKCTL